MYQNILKKFDQFLLANKVADLVLFTQLIAHVIFTRTFLSVFTYFISYKYSYKFHQNPVDRKPDR